MSTTRRGDLAAIGRLDVTDLAIRVPAAPARKRRKR
jgi:hypothetical protein